MTRRFFGLLVFMLAGWLASPGGLRADPANPAPDFKEVYDLLRANLPGATDETLNRAAVAGLLSQFHGKVSLAGGTADGSGIPPGGNALSQSAVIEDNVAYVRVGRVAGNLADELGAAGRALTTTNKIAGVVLDLRFAGGDDYAAARETAKLLAAKKAARPFAGALVVLVNGGTRGAAEALAVALREAGAALIIGNPTAGGAMIFKEFVLKDGEQLRIATPPAKAAGAGVSPVQPDIAVAVNADDERAFLENPYGTSAPDHHLSPAASNSFLPFVDHTSEADLVRQKQNDGGALHARDMDLPGPGPTRRQHNDSDGDEDSAPARAAEPQRLVIRDPVLARAVDLIKGLAVVRESRP